MNMNLRQWLSCKEMVFVCVIWSFDDMGLGEQVIIFIKDTDGELAEDYMGGRIGSRHQFDKKNEFETNLV